MSTYSNKLKDPRWQKMRLEILNRDGWKCRECAIETETLHVHHNFYQQGKEPWDYPLDSLITLCAGCHENEPEHRAVSEADLLLIFRQCGFTSTDLEVVCEKILRKELINGLAWEKMGEEACEEFLLAKNKIKDSESNG